MNFNAFGCTLKLIKWNFIRSNYKRFLLWDFQKFDFPPYLFTKSGFCHFHSHQKSIFHCRILRESQWNMWKYQGGNHLLPNVQNLKICQKMPSHMSRQSRIIWTFQVSKKITWNQSEIDFTIFFFAISNFFSFQSNGLVWVQQEMQLSTDEKKIPKFRVIEKKNVLPI